MLTSSPLPLETETMLRAELNHTEKLLWTGQPLPNRSTGGSLLLVIMGIPWTAFCVFWEAMAISIAIHARNFPTSASTTVSSSIIPYLFPLWGIPFILIGVGMLTAPYWMRRKAQKIVYALTDERGLILTPTWRGGVSVRSISPENLTDRTRNQNSDGSGSLLFNRVTVTRHSAGPDGRAYEVPIGFEHIADVRDVEMLMEKTYRPSA